jgi:inosine-uridine nucleoside N-ribohydrolase
MRIHLDTDLGGDTDDACALAMLLGWPGAQITGITTTADPAGRRAGYLAHCLELAGRYDIPVAAGAGSSLTTRQLAAPIVDDERHWPAALACRASPPGAALDLLQHSIDAHASVVAIGPFTNLALLEVAGRASWAGCRSWRSADGSTRRYRIFRAGGRRWTSTCSGTPTRPASSPTPPT